MSETMLYKDTVTDLNQGYRDLLTCLNMGDTRAVYLHQFEHILSQTIPDQMIWQTERYRRLNAMAPIPESGRAKVHPGVFRNYLMVYEQIMRDAGLIDKSPVETSIGIRMFDLGDDRMTADLDAYFSKIARPGAVWLTSGERGGGKTHTAVAVMEGMVKGRFPSMPRVVVMTNIIFYHRVGGRLTVQTPPGVHHIRTMRDLWPKVADTIDEYGRDVLIMLILDEAQGFIGGDSNYTNASIPMKEMLGTIRKYNMMVWFLTPTARSVGPAFRNLINAKNPGNLTCRWRKDLSLNNQWIEACHIDASPKEFMAVIPYDADPVMLRIPVTEWTGIHEDLREGEYCYDHIASAAFREGEGFDFNDFNDALGGVASIHAIDAIREFYRGMEAAESAKPEVSERDRKLTLAKRLHDERGMSWEDAADYAEIPYGTLKGWLSKERKDAERVERGHPISETARQLDGWMTGGSKSPPIYISKRGPENGGPEGAPHPPECVPEECSEGCPEGPSDELPEEGEKTDGAHGIPDGTYSIEEMRRAVHHCIGDDGEGPE